MCHKFLYNLNIKKLNQLLPINFHLKKLIFCVLIYKENINVIFIHSFYLKKKRQNLLQKTFFAKLSKSNSIKKSKYDNVKLKANFKIIQNQQNVFPPTNYLFLHLL